MSKQMNELRNRIAFTHKLMAEEVKEGRNVSAIAEANRVDLRVLAMLDLRQK